MFESSIDFVEGLIIFRFWKKNFDLFRNAINHYWFVMFLINFITLWKAFFKCLKFRILANMASINTGKDFIVATKYKLIRLV